MFKKLLTIGMGATLLAGSTTAFSANPPELRSVRIPASMCQPAGDQNNIPAGLVFNDNKWLLHGDGKNTVKAIIVCPIPVSEVSVNTGGAGNYMESIKLFYRDPDGAGDNARLVMNLRSMDKSYNRSLAVFDSHTYNSRALLNINFPITPAVIMARNQYYFLRVEMTKGPSFGSPEFLGFSFE